MLGVKLTTEYTHRHLLQGTPHPNSHTHSSSTRRRQWCALHKHATASPLMVSTPTYTMKSHGAAHLLHHDSVVPFESDIHIHVGLHGSDLVGCQEALPPAALPAALQDLHPAPGGRRLQPAGQHMYGFAVLGITPGCQVLQHQEAYDTLEERDTQRRRKQRRGEGKERQYGQEGGKESRRKKGREGGREAGREAKRQGERRKEGRAAGREGGGRQAGRTEGRKRGRRPRNSFKQQWVLKLLMSCCR